MNISHEPTMGQMDTEASSAENSAEQQTDARIERLAVMAEELIVFIKDKWHEATGTVIDPTMVEGITDLVYQLGDFSDAKNIKLVRMDIDKLFSSINNLSLGNVEIADHMSLFRSSFNMVCDQLEQKPLKEHPATTGELLQKLSAMPERLFVIKDEYTDEQKAPIEADIQKFNFIYKGIESSLLLLEHADAAQREKINLNIKRAVGEIRNLVYGDFTLNYIIDGWSRQFDEYALALPSFEAANQLAA